MVSDALQEHIGYISIKGRFELFQTAFASTIRSGHTVADLGCGVGILGLQCLRAGASRVYGVDSSEAIYLARETMDRAGLKERYQCMPGSTFNVELPERVDALVCDHVGYFGFDYGIIAMVRDAAARMLKPGGTIVPDRLRLFAAGVSSPKLRTVASAWNDDRVPEEYHWLDGLSRNSKFAATVAADALISSAQFIGEVNLRAQGPEFFTFSTDLVIEQSGLFDGIAGWFDCHLGGDTWMTNSPVEDRAIDRSQAFLPVLEPFMVEAGDRIGFSLRFDATGEMIAWSFTPPPNGHNPGKPQKLSTFHSVILAPNDLAGNQQKPVSLSKKGEARAFVLSQVNGERSLQEIVKNVLAERPDMLPSEAAISEFVEAVVKRDGAVDGVN